MQQAINALTLCSIYLLFSLGLTLAWGTLKVLNLAHGAVFVVSALTGFLVTRSFGLPYPLVVALGMICGGLLTLLIDTIVFRRIRSISRDERQAELLMLAASRAGPIDLNRFGRFLGGLCGVRLLRPKAEAAMRS